MQKRLFELSDIDLSIQRLEAIVKVVGRPESIGCIDTTISFMDVAIKPALS